MDRMCIRIASPTVRMLPEAVSVLRRVLARQKDGSVVIVQVGFSTNLARLLAADPDLVKRKVRLLSTMAARSRRRSEYNVKTDIPAARDRFPRLALAHRLQRF